MSELGDLLRKLRGKKSLREIAELAGISHNYLSVLEKGVDPRSGAPVHPTHDTLRGLSKALNHPYPNLLQVAGILEHDEVETTLNELVIKEIVSKYDIDLAIPQNRERLERILEIVVTDFERKN